MSGEKIALLKISVLVIKIYIYEYIWIYMQKSVFQNFVSQSEKLLSLLYATYLAMTNAWWVIL